MYVEYWKNKMWSIQDGKKKLDITKLTSNFKVISKNGLHLICPKKNLYKWDDNEERWLRSIVIDDNGFIVSCSWPKFENFGEFLKDTNILKNKLANNDIVHYTHKEDGVLCIRYVVNNKVIMRTRGTLFGGFTKCDQKSFGDRFKKVSQEKYSVLLDPNFMADRSLLFEYVAPNNVIVIHYKKEDLIFLGFVMHSNLHIGSWLELKHIANNNNLNLVKLHDLPRDILQLSKKIKTWKEEGIVVRCNNDKVFVKLKSVYYLDNHRMKFSMNYPMMVEFIKKNKIKTEQQLIENLQKCNYDWEIIKYAKDLYQIYNMASKIKDNILKKAQELYNNFKLNNLNDREDKIITRKRYAMIACEQEKNVRSLMFCIYDNNLERFYNYCHKIILSEGEKIKEKK
jgi:hypothetical protein